jgi:hypothetical protein
MRKLKEFVKCKCGCAGTNFKDTPANLIVK